MLVEHMERDGSYSIPYISDMSGSEDVFVIAIHGLGGSKNSYALRMAMDALVKKGIGALAFDLPAHGDSKADVKELRLENCIQDLFHVEESLRYMFPNVKIGYYAYGFGAFVLLHYLNAYPHSDARALLHSASITLPDVFDSLTPGKKEALETDGYLAIQKENGRPLKLTREFVRDVCAHDLFKIFDHHGAWIKMIHGCRDEFIDYKRAMDFAEKGDIIFRAIAEGDHALSSEEATPKVLKEFRGFFTAVSNRWYAPDFMKRVFNRAFYMEVDCSADEIKRAVKTLLDSGSKCMTGKADGDFEGVVREHGFRLQLITRNDSGIYIKCIIVNEEPKTMLRFTTSIDDEMMFGMTIVFVIALGLFLAGSYDYFTGNMRLSLEAVFGVGSCFLAWLIAAFLMYRTQIRTAKKILSSAFKTIRPGINVKILSKKYKG